MNTVNYNDSKTGTVRQTFHNVAANEKVQNVLIVYHSWMQAYTPTNNCTPKTFSKITSLGNGGPI